MIHNPLLSGTTRRPAVQPKLKIGEPGDRYEREADAVADRVMRMREGESLRMQPMKEEEERVLMQPLEAKAETMQPRLRMQPEIRRQCPACREEEALQRQSGDQAEKRSPVIQRSGDGGLYADASFSDRLQSRSGLGSPLPESVSREMGGRFGTDFRDVRVHTDSQAIQMNQDIGARAFTFGSDLFFSQGNYDPSAASGRHLLAHELTHVVQQTGSGAQTDTVQRECDDTIGPLPVTCHRVSKVPAGRNFLFKRGCDEFATGQKALLEETVRSLPDGATVDILGMASSEGSAEFNERLSCYRADAAAAVFRELGKEGSLALVEAMGSMPGTDNDQNYRAVNIEIHSSGTPSPPPPTQEPAVPSVPVPSAPGIPVASCPCPTANPSCFPGYCNPAPRSLAMIDRFTKAPGVSLAISALGGSEVGAIYDLFIWGGSSSVLTLSSTLRSEFETICQTAVATNHIMTAIVNAIWGHYPASTPAQTIPLSAVAPTAVSDIDTPGSAHELVYCGATNAPGLLAGGVGKTQLTTRIGAIPSPQNDARIATGHINVSRLTLPGGGSRLEFTPVIEIEVLDTVDFCPGNCGGFLAQGLTIPLSQWEASGISGDVPFSTRFAAPTTQLRKIVLQTVNGVETWSLEAV
jgi:outer membrane protein OmpA-like peptidoglycan-associated protein